MKKVLASMLLLPLLFCGCATQNKVTPLKEMPTMAELSKFYDSHSEKQNNARKQEVKAMIDGTSESELLKILTASLQTWADKQKPVKIDRVTLEGSADPLLMNENTGEKAYSNLSLAAGVYYDPQAAGSDEKALADKIVEQVSQALKETPYGVYKIHELKVTCYSLSGIALYESTGFSLTSDPAFAPAQSEEEKHLQAIAYEAVSRWNEEASKSFTDEASKKEFENGRRVVTLRRFGIDPSSKKLLAEIPVTKADLTKDLAVLQSGFEENSKALYQAMQQDEKAMAFLKKNGVSSAVISVSTPWAGNFDYSFDFGA